MSILSTIDILNEAKLKEFELNESFHQACEQDLVVFIVEMPTYDICQLHFSLVVVRFALADAASLFVDTLLYALMDELTSFSWHMV